jgi:c-di-GMP phosphodiesterase
MPKSNPLFIGRMPIYSKKSEIVCYEMMLVESDTKNIQLPKDSKSSAKLISIVLNLRGLKDVTGQHKAIVNVDKTFLMHEMILSVPYKNFILELHTDIIKDDIVLARIDNLKKEGFSFSLSLERDSLRSFSDLSKLSPLMSKFSISMEEIYAIGHIEACERLALLRKDIIIKNVEKRSELELFSKLKKSSFQGNFFTEVEPMSSKLPPMYSEAVMDLCNLLTLDKPPKVISDAFGKEPQMSLQLLQYVNSYAFSIKSDVKSIEQLVVLLGRDKLRNWLQLTLYSSSSKEVQPSPLLTFVQQRMELVHALDALMHPKEAKNRSDEVYFIALLSVIDVLLQKPMEEAIKNLSLAPSVRVALLEHKGELGELLAFVIAIEKFDLLPVHTFIAKYNIAPKEIEVFLQNSLMNADKQKEHL